MNPWNCNYLGDSLESQSCFLGFNDEKESRQAGNPSLVTRPQNQGKASYVIKEGRRDNHLPFGDRVYQEKRKE